MRSRSRGSMRCGRISALMSDGRTVGRPDGREGQTFKGESLVVRYINFVKLPHTIFALPFALLGVIVASYRQPVTWRVAILVIVAFTAARFVAMGFNRIADRRLDARNPRTQGRELPTGPDRKSTPLDSRHLAIADGLFCMKTKMDRRPFTDHFCGCCRQA